MTDNLPPGLSISVAAISISFRASISWFTSMRRAWNTFASSFFSRSLPNSGLMMFRKSSIVFTGYVSRASTMVEASYLLFFSSP